MTPNELATLLDRPSTSGPETGSPADHAVALGALVREMRGVCAERDVFLEIVATASRNEYWRKPVGEAGFIEFALDVVTGGARGSKKQALRLLGNACADTDENRGRVVVANGIAGIAALFSDGDGELLPFLPPVLYNILLDYEPAQQNASNAKLSTVLVAHLLQSGSENVQPLICKILDLLVSQPTESQNADPKTPFKLLSLALSPQTPKSTFRALATTALAYLATETFRSNLSPESLILFLDAVQKIHIDSPSTNPEEDSDSDSETDVEEQMRTLRRAAVDILSEISATESFSTACFPLSQSSVFVGVREWLYGSDRSLQAAACLCVGNLAGNDESSIEIVDEKLHERLVAIISDPNVVESQLLHAALSSLKNLAIAAKNKPRIGMSGVWENTCLPRAWSLDVNPQVQFDAMSLTRLLAQDPSNVETMCAKTGDSQTLLAKLLAASTKSDAEPSRAEAARTAAQIVRALHTSETNLLPSWSSTPLEDFHAAHDNIPRILAPLLTQKRFPALRANMLFLLALLAQTSSFAKGLAVKVLREEGALDAVLRCITPGKSVANTAPRVEEVLEEESGAEIADPASLMQNLTVSEGEEVSVPSPQDRENALVLVVNLLSPSNTPVVPSEWEPVLRDALKEGSEFIAGSRDGGD